MHALTRRRQRACAAAGPRRPRPPCQQPSPGLSEFLAAFPRPPVPGGGGTSHGKPKSEGVFIALYFSREKHPLREPGEGVLKKGAISRASVWPSERLLYSETAHENVLLESKKQIVFLVVCFLRDRTRAHNRVPRASLSAGPAYLSQCPNVPRRAAQTKPAAIWLQTPGVFSSGAANKNCGRSCTHAVTS